MAHFNFTVDTDPMAASIDGVADHVDGTTAAVVAMQAAVIVAEQEAAQKICSNVNTGFYSLIRSQISQKIAAHKSKADAKIMELQQQTVSLAAIKNRMERDYMMLANRYTRLFEGLNKSLRVRIFELDKPTASLVHKDVMPLASRTARLSGSPAITQIESITDSQVISISNTKNNALENITTMRDFIYHSEDQKRLIERILTKKTVTRLTEILLPFIVSETEGLSVRQSQWYITQPQIHNHVKTKIESHVYSSLSGMKWVDDDAANTNRVRQEYINLVNLASVSDRVKQQMISFIESAKWQKAQ